MNGGSHAADVPDLDMPPAYLTRMIRTSDKISVNFFKKPHLAFSLPATRNTHLASSLQLLTNTVVAVVCGRYH